MNTKNIKKEILEKIKSGKIEQKSKWFFLTKSYVFWFFTGLTAVLGGFAFASILFQMTENKIAFAMPKKPGHVMEGFAEALPYWWIIIFIGLIVIAYINYKNTYKSYARESIYIIFISVSFSLILGFIIFHTGLAKRIEYKGREFFPQYKKHIEGREKRVREFLYKNGYTKRDMRNPKIRKEAARLLREERKKKIEQRREK